MAAELRLIQNEEARQVYPLPQGVLTIGRDPTNHIQLDSPAVHARHARIFTVGDSSVIQDIAGSAGIFVNDDEIVHRKLCDEDIIYIGSHRFLFVNPAAPARSSATPADPEPASGAPATPQPVDDDTGGAEAPAGGPVQVDDPPSGTAPVAAADGNPVQTDPEAGTEEDDPVGAAGAVEAPARDAWIRGGNVYSYPAPPPLHALVDDDEPLAGAESATSPRPTPLALVTGDNEPESADDVDNTDDPPSAPPETAGPLSPAETGAAQEETGGSPAEAAPDELPAGNGWDTHLTGDEPYTPAEPLGQQWDTGLTGEEDYQPLVDADTGTEQTQALLQTAPGPTYADTSLPPLSDDADPPLEHVAPPTELVDFPPFTAGVEVLSGPNRGKRLMFSRPRIVLGRNGGRSVIIERHDNEYRVCSADRGAAVTLNGTLLLQEPVPLADGDHIEFAELSARFFQHSSISDQA